MLAYFVLGIALLAGFLILGRWFANAEPKAVIRAARWVLMVGGVALFILLAVSGRLFWAVMALPAVLPWLMRARAAARTARAFRRMAENRESGGSGQRSTLETRFLRMTLDHDSGEMAGQVLEGPFRGRELDDLTLAELVELLNACYLNDRQSAQVLETYLDRTHADWREQVAAGAEQGAGGGARNGAMSRDEALAILGLEAGADAQAVKAAYKRLIANLHPDRGGSNYLAAQINEAKRVLLGD